MTELQSVVANASIVRAPPLSSLVAAMLSIETILSASETDNVPSADDLRPVKGYVSGPR